MFVYFLMHILIPQYFVRCVHSFFFKEDKTETLFLEISLLKFLHNSMVNMIDLNSFKTQFYLYQLHKQLNLLKTNKTFSQKLTCFGDKT